MNSRIKILLLHLLLLTSSLLGQECYQTINNPSGIDFSSGQSNIETKACEIKSLFPIEYQNQFKVLDAGFYVHMGSFNGFGYPEGFDKLKSEITNQYYILIAAQHEQEGIFTDFWVDVKLPDITSDGCIPNLNEDAANLIEFILEKELSSPINYPQALSTTLEELKNYIEAAKQCCENGGSVAECIDCQKPNNIAAKLFALGFVSEPIQNLGDFNTGSESFPQITDYANQLFTVNNLTAVNIPSSYIDQIPLYESQGLSIKIYITKDENICSGDWTNIESEIENDLANVIFWHHIHKGENGLGDELLFSRVFLDGEGSNIKKNGEKLQKRMLGPDPVTAIIGALGSALSDALIQATAIYLTDDNVKEFGDAWSKVNYGSVAWSGFVGLFVISNKAIIVASAVGAATATITYKAFTDSNYTMEQATKDFMITFLGDLIGVSVGSAITNKLNNINISYLTTKGWIKLSKLIGRNYLVSDEIVEEMIELGINFTQQNLKFTAKNSKGVINFLEEGSESAGLLHIISRHWKPNELQRYFNNIDDMTEKMFIALKDRNYISKAVKEGSNPPKWEYIYKVETKTGELKDFLFAIGDNGFIVTFFKK